MENLTWRGYAINSIKLGICSCVIQKVIWCLVHAPYEMNGFKEILNVYVISVKMFVGIHSLLHDEGTKSCIGLCYQHYFHNFDKEGMLPEEQEGV